MSSSTSASVGTFLPSASDRNVDRLPNTYGLDRNEKTMVFIEGPSIYGNARGLDFDIDYDRISQFFRSRCRLVRIYYYALVRYIRDANGDEIAQLQPLLDFLQYHGYTVVSKDIEDTGPKSRGSTQVEFALNALLFTKDIDHVVLGTGDGDFTYLVKCLQEAGKRVSILSTTQIKPSPTADELRRQCDGFIDLADIKSHIMRTRTP